MKDYMKAAIAVLYLATGLIAAWQAYGFIMLAVWGAPTSPWQGVAVGGALVLLFAVPTLFARAFAGVVVGGVGCALLWSFHAPALFNTIYLLSAQDKDIHVSRQHFTAMTFLPSALVAISTVLSLVGLFKYRSSQPS